MQHVQDQPVDAYHPFSPESPLTSSLFAATNAIDDLTRSLADFSRVSTPEPHTVLTCCCAREDCEYTKAWLVVKSKLENRLILAAGASSVYSVLAHDESIPISQRSDKHYSRDMKLTSAGSRYKLRSSFRLAFLPVIIQSEDRELQPPTTNVSADSREIDPSSQQELEGRVGELVKENAVLEKVSPALLTLPTMEYIMSAFQL